MADPKPKAFLSYRRDDAEGQAGRLYDRLNAAFPGRVFRDVSGIGIGVNFALAIQDAIAASAVFIAVIGRQWVTIANAQGEPRLMQPHDYVRLEVATALERHLRMFPVLVDGAKMPGEESLPAELQELARINAIELTVTDYDHLVERLIGALESTLGPRFGRDLPDETAAQVETLVRRAEAAIAGENWMDAKQSLQSALSLDPGNASAAGRLRFAIEQMQWAGLYSDGQRLYQSSQTAAALERFRQLRAAGGSYKNVDQLIGQLEAELRPPPTPVKPKPHWLRWTAVGFAALMLIGYAAQQRQHPDNGPAPVYNPQPEANLVPLPAQADRGDPAPEIENNTFQPVGRWQMVSEMNPAYGMSIRFFPNGQFSVETMQGYYQFPASAGSYQYNGATHFLFLAGVNDMRVPFRETLLITGRHGDHFHVLYNGVQWALRRMA